jgi:predicted CoA-binding protein
VVNWETARIAHDGGLAVVMDRCTAIEHRKLLREGRRGPTRDDPG